MRSTIARLGALALAALMVVSAAPPRSAGAANEPYLIGATVSESGPGATLGRPEADSIQMAVDEINKAGGVNGHPLQATILDDESSATAAVAVSVELVRCWLTSAALFSQDQHSRHAGRNDAMRMKRP